MYRVNELQAGDILLMRDTTCIDAGIRLATTNAYTHAALVGHGVIIQATWPRVDHIALDTYCATGDRFTVSATAQELDTVVQAAEARVGQRYGLDELLLDAGRYIGHIPWTKRLPWMNHRLTCSGLVAHAYLQACIVLTYEPFPSPASLSYSPRLHGLRYWEGAA